MSAKIPRNAADDEARTVDVRVFNPNTGQPADRVTDLTGYVYISQSTYKFDPATGTITNKRRMLVLDDAVVEAVDIVDDELTITGHDFERIDGPFEADETLGTVLGGDFFWIIYVDVDTIAIANSLENALAGVKVALTGTEVGATISSIADTERGLDGKWVYTFTQPETDAGACELFVEILGHPTLEGGASAELDQSGSSIWEQLSEHDENYGDQMRAIRAVLVGDWVIIDGIKYYKSADGVKDRVFGSRTNTTRTSEADDLDP